MGEQRARPKSSQVTRGEMRRSPRRPFAPGLTEFSSFTTARGFFLSFRYARKLREADLAARSGAVLAFG